MPADDDSQTRPTCSARAVYFLARTKKSYFITWRSAQVIIIIIIIIIILILILRMLHRKMLVCIVSFIKAAFGFSSTTDLAEMGFKFLTSYKVCRHVW